MLERYPLKARSTTSTNNATPAYIKTIISGVNGDSFSHQTSNPKPQTPNLKPQTQNLKPQTYNPKPQTYNPKPQT